MMKLPVLAVERSTIKQRKRKIGYSVFIANVGCTNLVQNLKTFANYVQKFFLKRSKISTGISTIIVGHLSRVLWDR
jgi:hypothetical protein